MDVEFFKKICYTHSELITRKYSTSFSFATSLMEKEKRKAIYAIYGFVRLADEIVDSFHGYDKQFLLDTLQKDLAYALENKISINPILLAFADTVTQCNIPAEHIEAFMESMRCDLTKTTYTSENEIGEYIYGSANVVGLMCLKVFCNGEDKLYKHLQKPAESLGSAFQKVNFLRDLNFDLNELGRTYFPELQQGAFNHENKALIQQSIEHDFRLAYEGIRQLPGKSKLAVLIAYYYYNALFKKIKKCHPDEILNQRIRISNLKKYLIIMKVYCLFKLKLIWDEITVWSIPNTLF